MAVQADDVPDDEAPAPMTGSGARMQYFEHSSMLGWAGIARIRKVLSRGFGQDPKLGPTRTGEHVGMKTR